MSQSPKPPQQLHLNVNILHSGFIPSAWRLPGADPHAFVKASHYVEVARIAEAAKLGFARIFVPKGTKGISPVKGIEVVQVGQVNEVLGHLFG